MPKGEIVGMFIGRVCLSLIEITTVMMEGLQTVYMERIEANNEDTEEQAAKTQKNKVEKMRRNSAALHAEHKWAPGPR
jgi:hypothetical protein